MRIKPESTAGAAAISAVLIAVSGMLPFLGAVFLFMSIAPQIVLVRKGQTGTALASGAAAVIAAGFLRGAGFLLYYIWLFGIYCAFYCLFLKKEKSAGWVISRACFLWTGLFMIWAAVNYYVFNINVIENTVSILTSASAISIGQYYSTGVPFERIDLLNTSVISALEFFTRSFLGWVLISAAAGSWLVYYAVSRNDGVSPAPSIETFRLPDTMIWLLLGSGVLFFLSRGEGYSIISLASVNAGIVLLIGYIAAGTGVVLSLFSKWQMTAFMKFLLLISLFIFFWGFYVVLAAGIIDVWADFRSRLYKKAKE